MLTLSRCFQIIAVTIVFAATPPICGADADVTVPIHIRKFMLTMPNPVYPETALAQHITGRGLCDILIDPTTGMVTKVVFVQSTHSKLLDDAAGKAFARWRAHPGKVSRIRVPFTFTFAR
jgi:TonB family protein